MPSRLSLAHGTLVHVPPPDLVRIAAEVGYEAVGLRLIPVGRPGEVQHALHLDPVALRETRRALDESGVRVWDVELLQIAPGIDPRAHLPALEVAAGLGARYAIVNVYDTDRARAADALGVLCDLVAPLGLTIALEFVSFSALRTLADAAGMLEACGRANAAILVDTLHLHSSGEPLPALAPDGPDRFPYIHLCDGPRSVPAAAEDLRQIAREQRLLPGEGGIDLGGMLRRLPPGIFCAVEVHNPARAAALGPLACARLAFETTHRYVAATRG